MVTKEELWNEQDSDEQDSGMNRMPMNRTLMHSCSSHLFMAVVMADAVHPQVSTHGADDIELDGLQLWILGLCINEHLNDHQAT